MPEIHLQNLVTQAGIPDGDSVTVTIGAAGGIIQSSDGRMDLTIPAGALNEDREITMQPVTRQLPYGYGKTYRLTPHDISFAQPATVTFHYEADSIHNTIEELLGIAYQDQSGQWFSAGEATLDKTNHTLSVPTTHFSDWGYFPYFFLAPQDPSVATNGQLLIEVMATLPTDYFDIPSFDGKPLTTTYKPMDTYLGDWQYNGEGLLNGSGNTATYQAPGYVPAINPEAVSVVVKMSNKGQFLLVTHIMVRSDFSIDFMQVDETEVNSGGLDYPSRLYLYGSFGEDPGSDNRHVTISNVEVPVAYWTSNLIACDIPTVGPAAKGMVMVVSENKVTSKILNEWLVTLNYRQKQSPDGTLTKKINFILRLRGDADGFTQQPLQIAACDLHQYSKGIINVPAGSFHTHTTVDGCTDWTVNWYPIHDLIIDRNKNSSPGSEGLRGTISSKPEGFDIKLRLLATDVLMSHRIAADCAGGGSAEDVRESVDLQGFHEVVIPLRFAGKGSSVSLSGGSLSGGTGAPAAGLYWDAQDYHPEQFTRTLDWYATTPEIH